MTASTTIRAVPASQFQQQIDAVTADPSERGRFHVELSDDWNCPQVPQGGVLSAVTAHAMAAELDNPDQPLRSLQVVFAEPVEHGQAQIDTSVMRRGRSISQVKADVRSSGRSVGATAIGVFGSPRKGDEIALRTPPEALAPDDCWSWHDLNLEGVEGYVRFPFWQHVERRSTRWDMPWDPQPGGLTEQVSWFRYLNPPVDSDGTWHPLAILALCDMMPGAVFDYLGDGGLDFYGPSADLTVHMFGTTSHEWLLTRNRCRLASDGYASLEVEMWAGPHLVAYATQIMYFVYPQMFAHSAEVRSRSRAQLRSQNQELAKRAALYHQSLDR